MSLVYTALVEFPYFLGAAVYSGVGLLAAWTYRDFIASTARGVTSDLSVFARIIYRWVWMPLRILLALIQLPVHLSLLLARIDEFIGRALLYSVGVHFGKGETMGENLQKEGLARWTEYVSWCNVAMIIWGIIHIWVAWKLQRATLARDEATNADTMMVSTMMISGGMRKANIPARHLHARLLTLESVDGTILCVVFLLRMVIFHYTGSYVTIRY